MKQYHYPDKLEIQPLDRPVNAIIRVPGSKSITNRALVLAALACRKGPCKIKGALEAEDSEVMITALRQLGFSIAIEDGPYGLDVTVKTTNPLKIIPAGEADLFVGNSGTTMRFLTAMVSLGQGRYRLDGVPRMRERPIEDLLDALRQLGADARSTHNSGCPPVEINTTGLHGGSVSIRCDKSSQFLSGLLMAAPVCQQDIVIDYIGEPVSSYFLVMTTNMMHVFGAKSVRNPLSHRISVNGGQSYSKHEYEIEPDATSASYFFGAAAISQGHASVVGLPIGVIRGGEPDRLCCSLGMQGDGWFVRDLGFMGCWVDHRHGLKGAPLRGIDIDMNDISDTVMTLAAVACFAEGPTTIRNVAHIRHKETDRIAALATELRRVGAEVEEYPDGLKITPRPLHGAEIETYNDHRMAMSMALIGLKVPGIVIKNPGCVAKTYPGYWEDFQLLYK